MELKEGQKLWYVSTYSRYQGPVTITKVGRKWAQLDNNERIDIKTMLADGKRYSSPGECYASKKEYDAEVEFNKLFKMFVRAVCAMRMRETTIENISAAASILGINLSDDK